MRSPTFERQWYEQVARAAQRWGIGPERFFDVVAERLAKGAREYGENSWAQRQVIELIAEITEEGADVVGWGVLVAQLLNNEIADGEIESDRAADVQGCFIRAAAHGLLLQEEMRKAGQDYRAARAETEWRRKLPAGSPP